MPQILQNLSNGSIETIEPPIPQITKQALLIETQASLISAGTERMLLNFGKASLLGKVKQQPDKVKDVLNKIKTDGLLTTLDAVKSKLNEPIPLGYCNVGRVMAVGMAVHAFQKNDRVVSNGPHASLVRVGQNLCAKIPEAVSDTTAAFTVMAAIGLQGIRLANLTLGETVAVFGLGLIGLLTVQMLKAQGCQVIGIDFNEARLKLAEQYGAKTVNLSKGQDPVAFAESITCGVGVDAVLITAATQSNEPVTQAAHMSRQRGRIILVGVTGLELSRDDFYKKELSFQVSCSYGPGRYDEAYEVQGQDYPLPYVRWTEQRNFEAVLALMADGKIDVSAMVTHVFQMTEAEKAYDVLHSDKTALGILLKYPAVAEFRRTVQLNTPSKSHKPETCTVACIGSGSFASRVLIPAFKAAGAHLKTLVSSQGVSSVVHGKRQGFEQASTDFDAVLADASINTVVIATRHEQHAKQVVRALRAGKHVFVEKPLAITKDELDDLKTVYEGLQQVGKAPLLMVGFNRRFAPMIVKTKKLLERVKGPKAFVMTVNAGAIPKAHWTQDPQIGGGRLMGEGCHFVDLLRFLANSPIIKSDLATMVDAHDCKDTFSLSLSFEDGSIGTVHYFANGSKRVPKEKLTVYAGGKVIEMNNYRRLDAIGFGKLKSTKSWRQDKGHGAEVKAFVDSVQSGTAAPIHFADLIEVSDCTIEQASK